ncbi:hypothetical protein L1887_06152 [Cichorium endivia]|nr:hypothetical protein L1887_06152 [Cichorium endivia]
MISYRDQSGSRGRGLRLRSEGGAGGSGVGVSGSRSQGLGSGGSGGPIRRSNGSHVAAYPPVEDDWNAWEEKLTEIVDRLVANGQMSFEQMHGIGSHSKYNDTRLALRSFINNMNDERRIEYVKSTLANKANQEAS